MEAAGDHPRPGGRAGGSKQSGRRRRAREKGEAGEAAGVSAPGPRDANPREVWDERLPHSSRCSARAGRSAAANCGSDE